MTRLTPNPGFGRVRRAETRRVPLQLGGATLQIPLLPPGGAPASQMGARKAVAANHCSIVLPAASSTPMGELAGGRDGHSPDENWRFKLRLLEKGFDVGTWFGTFRTSCTLVP